MTGFVLLANFNRTVHEVTGLTSLLPAYLILAAGIFSIASWWTGVESRNRLAALQLIENSLYSGSLVSLTAFSEPPASFVFSILFAVICIYWGIYFAFSTLGLLALALPQVVLVAMGALDTISDFCLLSGLVMFFTAGKMTAHRRAREEHTARSEDVFTKLEGLIAEQSAAAGHMLQARVAAAVHDLKNDIVPACLDLDESLALIRDPKPRELVSRSLGDIRRIAESLERFLAQLKLEHREFPWFPLDELRDEVERMAANHRQGARLEIGSLPQVFVPGQIDLSTLSLRNLIANAFDAGASAVRIAGRLTDDLMSVELTVADDGPGLPPSVERNLFKPYNTHGKSHGVGLGIYLTGQVIRAAGGSIELAKTGASGTTFRIALPVVDPNTGASTELEGKKRGGDVKP